MSELVVIDKSALEQIIESAVTRALEKVQPRASSSQRMLTAKQAAEYLELSTNTIYILTRKGEIPYITVGKAKRYNTIELDKLNLCNLKLQDEFEKHNFKILAGRRKGQ